MFYQAGKLQDQIHWSYFYKCKQRTNLVLTAPMFSHLNNHTMFSLYVGPIHPLSALCIHTGQWRHHSCMTMAWPEKKIVCFVYTYKYLNITQAAICIPDFIPIWYSWNNILSCTQKWTVFVTSNWSSTFQKIRVTLSLICVHCYHCDKDSYHMDTWSWMHRPTWKSHLILIVTVKIIFLTSNIGSFQAPI